MLTDLGNAKYGMSRIQPYGSDVSAVSASAVTTAHSASGALNADNPMLWLVGIGAVTLGLVAFSTHVRIGKFAASASAG